MQLQRRGINRTQELLRWAGAWLSLQTSWVRSSGPAIFVSTAPRESHALGLSRAIDLKKWGFLPVSGSQCLLCSWKLGAVVLTPAVGRLCGWTWNMCLSRRACSWWSCVAQPSFGELQLHYLRNRLFPMVQFGRSYRNQESKQKDTACLCMILAVRGYDWWFGKHEPFFLVSATSLRCYLRNKTLVSQLDRNECFEGSANCCSLFKAMVHLRPQRSP